MLGIGAMLGYLGGNEETIKALTSVIDKTITGIKLSDDVLHITFEDGGIKVWDDGQLCCETRFMRTDDVLEDYIGAKLLGMETREAPDVDNGYDAHEVQFLVVKTDKGNVTFSNHNEHNGYYGGFSIVIRTEDENGRTD